MNSAQFDLVDFAALRARYKVFLFDAFGVLNDSNGLIAGAEKALTALNNDKQPFLVVSNDSSNSVAEIAAKFKSADGKQLVKPEQIISSGLLAQQYLVTQRRGSRIVYFGERRSGASYLQSAASELIHIADLDRYDNVDIFVMLGCGAGEWRTYLDKTLNLVWQNPQLELIAPNPDLIFLSKPGEINIASGSLAQLISRALHREFKFFGKPHAAMFDVAWGRAQKLCAGVKKSEVLMVGDNLMTDIKGALACGLDSLLVLSGVTREEQLRDEIDQTGVQPTHVTKGLS